MARIAGVNLPAQKHVWVGLQSIYGIGRTRSKQVCEAAGVDSRPPRSVTCPSPKSSACAPKIGKFVVEGDLRREVGIAHQAFDGPGLLPRPASPSRLAAARPAHPHQCPYPQGSAQARIPEEVRDQTMAKACSSCAKRIRKKIKRDRHRRHRPRPRFFQQHHHHDHRPPGQRAVVGDVGRRGFHAVRASRPRSPRRSLPKRLAVLRWTTASSRLEVRIKGPGPGRESVCSCAEQRSAYKIINIIDVTPDPAQRLPSAEEASRLRS